MSDTTQAKLPPPATANYSSKSAPLNPSLYNVDEEFLSALTGITDREELKEHILKVQADAYEVGVSSDLIFGD